MANLINTIRAMNQPLDEAAPQMNAPKNIRGDKTVMNLRGKDGNLYNVTVKFEGGKFVFDVGQIQGNRPTNMKKMNIMQASKLFEEADLDALTESHFKAGDTVLWKGMKGSVVSSTGEGDDEVYTVKCEDGKTYQVPARQLEGMSEMAPEVGPPEPAGSGKKVNPKDVRWDVDQTIPKTYDKMKKEEVEIEIDVNDELWEQFIGELNEEGVQLDELDWQGIKDRYSKFYGGLGDKIANSKPVSAVSNVASKIKDRYSKFYGGIGDKSISDTLPKTTSQVKAIGKFASSAADAAGDAVSKAVDVVKPYANKGFDKLKAYVNKPRPKEPTKPQPSEPSKTNSMGDLETKKKFAGAKADWTGPGKGVASKTDAVSKPDWKGPGRGVAEEVELDEATVSVNNVGNAVSSVFNPSVAAKVMSGMKTGGKKEVTKNQVSSAMTKMGLSPRQVANVLSKLAEEVELDEARVTKDNVAKLLVKYGNNPKSVKQMIDKEFDRAVKAHPTATAAKIADVIRVTAESVELDEEPFTGIGKMMMKRKLKKGSDDSFRKAGEILDTPLKKNKKDKWFYKHMDDYARKNKALNRLNREEVELDEAPLNIPKAGMPKTLKQMMSDYIDKTSDDKLIRLAKVLGKNITIKGNRVIIEETEIDLDEEMTMSIKTVEEAKKYGLTQSLLDAVKGVLAADGDVDSKPLDPVNKKAAKGKFDDRKDKDIDNDGDVDKSDKYLHNRRKAVTKAVEKDKKAESKSSKADKEGKAKDGKEAVEINPNMSEASCKTMKEAEMTDAQMKKREEIVKSMKKSKGDFEKRYGDRAKDVMYATATKMAMKEGFEFESAEAFFEAADIPFDGPYRKVKRTVTDKSGAKHTPMSRAKDLAQKALKKGSAKNEELELDEAGYKVPKNYAAMMLKKRKKANDKAQKDLKDPSHNPSWANSKSK